jgi:hypothetical protein
MARKKKSYRKRSRSYGGKLGNIGLAVASGLGMTYAITEGSKAIGMPQVASLAPIAGLATAYGASKGGMLEKVVAVLPFVSALGINLGGVLGGVLGGTAQNGGQAYV